MSPYIIASDYSFPRQPHNGSSPPFKTHAFESVSLSSAILFPFCQADKSVHRNSKKNQAPGQKTRRYKRDIDQIHDDLKDAGRAKLEATLLHNDIEELPGRCFRTFVRPTCRPAC